MKKALDFSGTKTLPACYAIISIMEKTEGSGFRVLMRRCDCAAGGMEARCGRRSISSGTKAKIVKYTTSGGLTGGGKTWICDREAK